RVPGQTAGVIASAAEFRLAVRMARPPDLFELRLDCLFPARDLESQIDRLPAPVIATARHPAEGGEQSLPLQARRDLLLRFLPGARFIDIELRSARAFRELLDRARRRQVGTIISFHQFDSTPTLGSLRAMASRAKALGAAVFKVATRTDTPAQLGRLLEFITENDSGLPVSAMGMGRLGAASRLLLAQNGSALIYTAIRKRRVEGQLSLDEFRRAVSKSGPS
ncbi:MAG: quiB, partial [Spartobacteria bacterium]|nr:quiB [Spartobacteria bacterium]